VSHLRAPSDYRSLCSNRPIALPWLVPCRKQLAFRPDEQYLLGTNGLSDDVSVIDVASLKAVKTNQVSEQPWTVFIAEP
jgi:YVTN family beta-propeller protein